MSIATQHLLSPLPRHLARRSTLASTIVLSLLGSASQADESASQEQITSLNTVTVTATRREATSPVAVTGVQPSTSSTGSADDDDISGRTGLQYGFSDDLTGYITYSRGYKGPAYNTFLNMQPRGTGALKPEKSDSYEVGLKATALDKRLSANIALFHSDYDESLANCFDTVASQVVPELQRRGLFRTEYQGSTLREHLGLPYPRNPYFT